MKPLLWFMCKLRLHSFMHDASHWTCFLGPPYKMVCRHCGKRVERDR